jgi:two-component system chemotaxis sensor kinase CheA
MDPELMSDFIVESREHLVNIECQLLTLEREPSDTEALNAVFRGFHTIKGLAGFLELWEVQQLAHEVETVLDRARNSQWTVNPAGIDVILASSDYLRRWLVHIQAVLHHEPSVAPVRDVALLSRITRLSAEPGGADSAGLAALADAVSVHHEKPVVNPPVSTIPVAAATGEKTADPVIDPVAAAAPVTGRRQETMAVKVDTAKLDYLVDMAGKW